MTAEIVVLAEYRARASLRLTFDPLVLWRAWFSFWMGSMAPNRRAARAGSGVVRALVAR
ncbi:hypothetical protein GPA27_13550 [Aromatoleum toluolicum]|uniref:Uncharacterized protein n=1 Tax=Aromatoleum toluolicum TaxID=90060 RepID=A0ABX1NGI1_9RHOO|nr:hypothetical protein [Aromatoleum toluolicum]NMF98411.1 hypothetical protein [Aromatoleum toluolicum]